MDSGGNNFSESPNKKKFQLETLKKTSARTTVSRSEIYRRVAEGTFPKPIKLGKRAVAFDSEAIDAWIAQLIAESHAAVGKYHG